MDKELLITKDDLVNWLNRPPNNDDLDLIGFITTRLENFYKLEQENKELKRMCELYSKSLYNADLTKANQKIDKAIEELKNEDYIDKLPYIDEEDSDKRRLDYWFEVADKLDDKRLKALEILGDKENE